MSLITERGARRVSLKELCEVPLPAATPTWHPVSHDAVLGMVTDNLERMGFAVRDQSLALSAGGQQFFGTLDLESNVVEGVNLAVGIRNSTNKSLAAAMCAGERVLVCSNLAFASEIMVSRKHTAFVKRDFSRRVCEAIESLRQYREVAALRIDALRQRELLPQQADSFMLRAYEAGIIGARLLPKVIAEWREPRHEEFAPRTAWSLFNAFTEAIKDRQRSQPAKAAAETIRLQELLTAQAP